MTEGKNIATNSAAKIELFLDRLAGQTPAGKLIFALDATMSRQPTWDKAGSCRAICSKSAIGIGSLELQLIYFRGDSECRASGWLSDSKRLADAMCKIDVRGGYTQIGKILSHAKKRARPLAGIGAGVCRRRDGGENRRSLRRRK